MCSFVYLIGGDNIKHVTEKIRRIAQKDSTMGHLIHVVYYVFSNEYSHAFSSVLGTIIIAVLIGCGYYRLWFWAASILYLICVFLSAWATRHMRRKTLDNKAFQDALHGMSEVLRSWAIKLQKCANKIRYAKNGKYSKNQIELILSEIDLQTAAFSVCEKLRRFLTAKTDPDDVYITVYKKYEEAGETRCRMLAYSGEHEPTSKDDFYIVPPFDQNLYGKIEYHSYLFSSNKKEISVLFDHTAVEKAFKPHINSEEREKKIQQFIAIPIAPAKKGVVFLLQVDTIHKAFFGDSKESVEEFAKNTIYPYAQYLHMVYEESRTIMQLL